MVFRRGEIHQAHVEGVPIGLLEDREYEEVELRWSQATRIAVLFRWSRGSIERQGRGLSRGRA